MGKCDVLKISDNEVEFLFGTTDYDKGAALIRENTTFLWCLSLWEKTEAALITRISEWRLLLSFRKTPLKLPAPRYFLRKRSQLCSGAWSGGSDCRKLKRASDLCQRSRFSDHHQKRRASRYAVQRRSSGIYRIQTVIFPWNRL